MVLETGVTMRSRMRLVISLLLGVVLVAVAGCGGGGQAERRARTESAEARLGSPAGWRWEYYRGLKVRVPDTWGHGGSSGQLADQWCLGDDHHSPSEVGVVARPGPETMVACPGSSAANGPDPGTLVANGGSFVGFDAEYMPRPGTVHEGDRTTVTLRGVSVTVQAPERLREQIVRTIRPASTDANGCPVSHPISGAPGVRPQPAVPVDALRRVTSVSACKYSLPFFGTERVHRGLLSSIRITGPAAQNAIENIKAAPRGGGPDSPQTCLARVSYGDEAIVLRISSAQGHSEVLLRYSGCDHNGFDDGHGYHRLTHDAVAPFVAGPNMVFEVSGLGKGKIFRW